MSKIEMGKTYRTRDGREVRIYAVDGVGEYPIHGAIPSHDGKGWELCDWTIDGKYLHGPSGLGGRDLIEVKPRIRREVWVNVYHSGAIYMHDTRADADYAVTDFTDKTASCRIACIPLTIDCAEGDGL